ncbi:tryptophan 2,3-dioxygenase [candidate division KSB1 bacterium]|nr:tryptophan 2,3-dioxygenase [candidate division KSB1 bacterium]
MSKPYPPVYYSDYLQLDRLLASQTPKSAEYGKPAHDETLFIIVHQVYELWFKQIIHELSSIIHLFAHDYVDEKNIGVAVARLNRITEIQKLLIDQLRVLETMTPLDFLEFREYLLPASGFQSIQFRLIENLLGMESEQRLLFNKEAYYVYVSPEHQAVLRESEHRASLFQHVQRWLERTPFLDLEGFQFWPTYRATVERMLQNDRAIILNNTFSTEEEKHKQLQELSKNEESFAALFDEHKHKDLIAKGRRRLSYQATQAALLIHLYRDEPILHQPFRLLTVLVDMDELFTSWRYRHALMVHRMIGNKIGTGGSTGYHYLRATVEKYKIFADLFDLSTFLIPRSKLPELPEEIKKSLGFYYSVKSNTETQSYAEKH